LYFWLCTHRATHQITKSSDGVPQLKKLLNLKEWLTAPEAAHHLSLLFGEDVRESDVLRLALDGRLTLSVHFVNDTECLRGPLVPIQEAKRDNARALGKNGKHPIEGVIIDDDRVIECGSEIGYIRGVWDLPMIGAERVEIESRYQVLNNGPMVERDWVIKPIIVSMKDGTYCQLMTLRTKDWSTGEKRIFTEPYLSTANYDVARGLPEDTLLVVRTSALRELEARVSKPDQEAEKPLELRERTTLLVIIAALAELAEVDVKKPAKAGLTIESQTVRMGAEVSSRAIQDHLNRIPEALARRGK